MCYVDGMPTLFAPPPPFPLLAPTGAGCDGSFLVTLTCPECDWVTGLPPGVDPAGVLRRHAERHAPVTLLASDPLTVYATSRASLREQYGVDRVWWDGDGVYVLHHTPEGETHFAQTPPHVLVVNTGEELETAFKLLLALAACPHLDARAREYARETATRIVAEMTAALDALPALGV